jgi:hypothetical protein
MSDVIAAATPFVLRYAASRNLPLIKDWMPESLLGHVDAVEWLTVPKALEEMDAVMATAADTELELVREHEQ